MTKKNEISREELSNLLWGSIGPLSIGDIGWWLECKTADKYTTVERQFIIEAFEALENCCTINDNFRKKWLDALPTLRKKSYNPEQNKDLKVLQERHNYTATVDDCCRIDNETKSIFIDLIDIKDSTGKKIKNHLSLSIKELSDRIDRLEVKQQISFSAQIAKHYSLPDGFTLINFTLLDSKNIKSGGGHA